MDSKIKNLLKLKNHIVAAVQSDACPEKSLQFKAGKWGCSIAMLAAANGKIAAFSAKNTTGAK